MWEKLILKTTGQVVTFHPVDAREALRTGGYWTLDEYERLQKPVPEVPAPKKKEVSIPAVDSAGGGDGSDTLGRPGAVGSDATATAPHSGGESSRGDTQEADSALGHVSPGRPRKADAPKKKPGRPRGKK